MLEIDGSGASEANRTPGVQRALTASTVCEAFQIAAATHPNRVALRTADRTIELTWADYVRRVRDISGGLSALGMRRGDTLGMMLVNRPEFNLVDTAAMHLGVTSFSLYNTLPVEQIAYQLENSRASVVVTEMKFLEQVLAARTPAVHTVILVDGANPAALSLADIEGNTLEGFDFEVSWRSVESSDVLTLIYTSGTTGPPKGVEITHANVQAACQGLAARVPPAAGGRVLSFLPAAHAAERFTAHYYPSLCLGCTVTSVADLAELPRALREVRPTIFMAVARVFEKLRAGLEVAGVTHPAELDTQSKARALGMVGLDKTDFAATGGGPISTQLLQFFADLGLPILEAWGMSELTGLASINPPDDARIGSAGIAFPGMELRVADDGELLARGPQVMLGYRNDAVRTAEAFDADGWLRTGDIASIDSDGYVRIVDRKKEIIINAGGKNMSPANIEHELKAANPLIGQAVCIGDGRRYNVALLVLDPDTSANWATARGRSTALDSLAADEELVAEIEMAVREANSHLARVEQIKRFRVLSCDWLPSGEELTPTSKLKRSAIDKKYAAVIDEMYTD